MAYSVVQSISAQSNATVSFLGVTPTATNVTLGNRIIVVATSNSVNTLDNTTTVTDNAGNTYNQHLWLNNSYVNATVVCSLVVPSNIAGTKPTITVNFKAAGVAKTQGGSVIDIMEVSGLNATNGAGALDVITSAGANSAGPATVTAGANSAASGELVLSIGSGNGDSQVWTMGGSGYTQDLNNTSTAIAELCIAHKNSTSGTAEVATWTLAGTNSWWDAVVAVFKLSAVAPTSIAYVGAGAVLQVAATSISPTKSCTAGNLVVACVFNTFPEVFTSSSSGWVKAVGAADPGNANLQAEIWYLPGANNAGGTITPTFSTAHSDSSWGFLAEFSGADSTSPLRTTASGSTAGAQTTGASGTLSGNVATDVAVTAFAEQLVASGAMTWTAGASYTNMAKTVATGNTVHVTGDYRLLAPVGNAETQTASVASRANGWAGVIATFKVPSGATLAGTSAWVSAASGNAADKESLQGTTTWVSAESATPSSAEGVGGTTAWSSATTGTLTTASGATLQGTTAWTSAAIGSAAETEGFSGTTAWLSTASGNVADKESLGGTSAWASSASGTLTTASGTAFQGTSAWVSATNDTLTEWVALNGTAGPPVPSSTAFVWADFGVLAEATGFTGKTDWVSGLSGVPTWGTTVPTALSGTTTLSFGFGQPPFIPVAIARLDIAVMQQTKLYSETVPLMKLTTDAQVQKK